MRISVLGGGNGSFAAVRACSLALVRPPVID
jgi:hypothetical protein